MDRFHYMDRGGYEAYRTAVQRKGKAMLLPYAERTGKYGKEYKKVIELLRQNFKPYVLYCISGGKNDFAKDKEAALAAVQAVGQEKRIFAGINTALSDGDLNKLDRHMDQIKGVYKRVWESLLAATPPTQC